MIPLTVAIEASTACEVLSLAVRGTAACFITAYLGRKVYLLVNSTLQNMNLPPMLFKAIDTIVKVVGALFCFIVAGSAEVSLLLGFAFSATKIFGDTVSIKLLGFAIGTIPAAAAFMSIWMYLPYGSWRPF